MRGFHKASHDLARALMYELLHPLDGHLVALTKPQLLLYDPQLSSSAHDSMLGEHDNLPWTKS